MSKFIDLVKRRRSIRQYRPDHVPHELIETCIEAARYAPTACNTQGWRFIVVEGEMKDRLVEESLGGVIIPNRWATTAPAVVVIAMDRNLITHRIGGGIKGISYHFIDAGIAGEHFVLQAAELGLGTCWLGWFKKKVVKRLLELPGNWDVAAMITIGYPAVEPAEKKRRPVEEITSYKGK